MKIISILMSGLLLAAIVLPIFAKPQSIPAWKPDRALVKQLVPAAAFAGCTFLHPNGYQINRRNTAHVHAFDWVSPVREDGSRGVIVVTWMIPPKQELNRLPLNEYLNAALETESTIRIDWNTSPIERGSINGTPFNRVYWTGKDKYNQIPMHGFIYITRVGNKIIEFSSQDFVPTEEKYLALAEASILTFKAK